MIANGPLDERDDQAATLAIKQAKLAASLGELPYGAVVVGSEGEILGAAHDEVVSSHDLTAHAEILAVRQATSSHGWLAGATLVATVEPCAMCFSAAWTAGVTRLAFGLSMRELRARRPDSMDEITITSDELNQRAGRTLDIVTGVRKDECWSLWTTADG
jgi:tRNA(adenine34) deaminase